VQERGQDRQLFIATHSGDVLRGLLDSGSGDVRVLRVTRNGSNNAVHLLDNSRIKDLWKDSLLRYSNILDGLFHEGVVVCEADGDCRFYAAILDVIYSGGVGNATRPDLMFTHCGGKARLQVVVRALREAGVPTCAVADFDILSEEQPLRGVAEALGLDWNTIYADWRVVRDSLNAKKPDLNTNEVKEQIQKLLSATTESPFPTTKRDEIQKVLRRSSPWSAAKEIGKTYVPAGDATQACERLLKSLREARLHVVEVGEMEGFDRTVGGHGQSWLNEILKRDLAADPKLEAARQFVRTIIRTF
jgi:hypothetical protein